MRTLLDEYGTDKSDGSAFNLDAFKFKVARYKSNCEGIEQQTSSSAECTVPANGEDMPGNSSQSKCVIA